VRAPRRQARAPHGPCPSQRALAGGHAEPQRSRGLLSRPLAQDQHRNPDETWDGTYWNSPDHRAVGRAALDAGNRWVFPGTGAEPWNGVRWVAVTGGGSPTHAVDVTGTLERGVRVRS
jgi:hypothetical protein